MNILYCFWYFFFTSISLKVMGKIRFIMQPFNFHVAKNLASIKHCTFVVIRIIPVGV